MIVCKAGIISRFLFYQTDPKNLKYAKGFQVLIAG